MANKKLGSSTPTADTETTLYTVPTLKAAVFNINVCNAGIETALITIKVGGDIIEFNAPVGVSGVLERTGLIAGASEAVVVKSSMSTVTFRAYGIEE